MRFFLLDFFAEVTRSSADRHSFLAAAVAFRRAFFRSPTVDFLKAATFVLRAGDFFADARFFRRAAFLCGIFRSSLMVKGSSLEIDQCKASGFRRVDFRIAWKGLNSSQVIFLQAWQRRSWQAREILLQVATRLAAGSGVQPLPENEDLPAASGFSER